MRQSRCRVLRTSAFACANRIDSSWLARRNLYCCKGLPRGHIICLRYKLHSVTKCLHRNELTSLTREPTRPDISCILRPNFTMTSTVSK